MKVLLLDVPGLRQSSLGCYGNEWIDTPHLDRLASEGVRFSNAYGAAWCTPSRACVLTGLMPHGIRGLNITGVLEGGYDPQVCRFWPATLRRLFCLMAFCLADEGS